MIKEPKMYFVKDTPSVGTHICLEHNGQEYPIALMRWTDGMNTKVEQSVANDARRIAASLNYCSGMSIDKLEASQAAPDCAGTTATGLGESHRTGQAWEVKNEDSNV